MTRVEIRRSKRAESLRSHIPRYPALDKVTMTQFGPEFGTLSPDEVGLCAAAARIITAAHGALRPSTGRYGNDFTYLPARK